MDTPYDSENICDNKVHNNSEKLKHIEEEKKCPVLSALRLKYKLKCQSNDEEIPRRRTGCSLGKQPIGLKGGANGNSKQNRIGLKLINNRSEGTGNICFVNSVVQLFKWTGYATFLLTQLSPLLLGNPVSSYKGARALFNLYCEKTAR